MTFLLIIVVAIVLYVLIPFKIKKSALWKLYGVTDKTFHKWIRYLKPMDLVDFTSWKKMRKVDGLLVIGIIFLLGNPTEGVKTKSELMSALNESSHTIRMNALKGVTEHYTLIDKFPPATWQEIIEHIG